MRPQCDTEKLEQYLVLARMCKGGAGLADVASRALAEPGLFVYGELFALPNVQEVAGTSHEPVLRTIELFTFGTWMDYKGLKDTLLPLSPEHEKKLKQLTMCTLAKKKVLKYSELQSALNLGSVRELEDFIIQDCMYPGLLRCKLDQINSCIRVHSIFSRDVRPEQLPDLSNGLQCMLQRIEGVMAELKDNIQNMAQNRTAAAEAEAKFKEDLENERKIVEDRNC